MMISDKTTITLLGITIIILGLIVLSHSFNIHKLETQLNEVQECQTSSDSEVAP